MYFSTEEKYNCIYKETERKTSLDNRKFCFTEYTFLIFLVSFICWCCWCLNTYNVYDHSKRTVFIVVVHFVIPMFWYIKKNSQTALWWGSEQSFFRKHRPEEEEEEQGNCHIDLHFVYVCFPMRSPHSDHVSLTSVHRAMKPWVLEPQSTITWLLLKKWWCVSCL